MAYENLLVEQDNAVFIVTINRPNVLNALNVTTLSELSQAIDQAVNSPNPPLRLLLGKVDLQGARTKIEEMTKDFDAWAKVTEGADFPD